MWEHFHHQADIGIRGTGRSLAEAFEGGAMALMAVICDPAKVADDVCVSIVCEADDHELLFIDWINALIYEMDVRKLLFCRFQAAVDDGRLTAKAWGEPADPERHDTAVGVKAATYLALTVFCDDQNQWIAQCAVDV